MTSATVMNRSSSCCLLMWLVCVGTIAGQYLDPRSEERMPKDKLTPKLGEEYDIDDDVREGRGLDLSLSLNLSSSDEDDARDRGLFAAFEGSTKYGKHRGGGMFYGGRRPVFDDPRYGGGYFGRPLSNVGYNGMNRNRYADDYGSQFRVEYEGNRGGRYPPGRGFYRQPYPSPY